MTLNELSKLYYRMTALSLFRDFMATEIGVAVFDLLETLNNSFSEEEVISCYAALAKTIYEGGGDLSLIVKEYVSYGDSPYIEKYIEDRVTKEMDEALANELDTLQKVSSLASKDVIDAMEKLGLYEGEFALPTWSNSRVNLKRDFAAMLKNLGTRGYGLFSQGTMFKVKDGEIVPVINEDYQTIHQLYGYDRERTLVLKNTAALAEGKVASNVLLYGDAGTGKSTTVKACAAQYSSKGIRLIEFDKNQVSLIPDIAEELAGSPLKFIFFIDDLTFAENDEDYYALKGILEGNVSGTAPNILIYATSNRRHLVKENTEDRMGTDIHLNDTLQETMSLSSRFGLTVTFSKPAKDLYLEIVESLAKEQGLLEDKGSKAPGSKYQKQKEDLLTRAEAFAIRANGRSPRTAKQFVVLAKNGLA